MDKNTVNQLAKLSRIELKEGEAEKLAGELERILNYVEEIKSATNLQEQAKETGRKKENHPNRNLMREDAEPHESGIYTEDLLNSAPDREGGYVKVKKIL